MINTDINNIHCCPTLVPPLKWFSVWPCGVVRICPSESLRERKTKDHSNTADLVDALIGSVLKSQRGENVILSYFDLKAHQQCIYDLVEKTLGCFHQQMKPWSFSFPFRDAISGINQLVTCGQLEDAEEQPSDIREHSFLYKYCLKWSLIPVWSKYGFSSIKQCLSKRHC